MSPTALRLLSLLADGEMRSGAALASTLGVTRSAIWKLVGELRAAGIAVTSVARRGYQLAAMVELLDLGRIRAAAREADLVLPEQIELRFDIDSTSDALCGEAPAPHGKPRVLFAELQRAGRGRRGRRWIAPFGSGLTFSVGWTFAETPPDLPALSLALGVAVARTLQSLGASGIGLKWPNDILRANRKLGGLLIQLRQEAGGPATVVVGLGINLRLPDDARRLIDRADGVAALPPTDLATGIAGPLPSRNAIAARLVAALSDALARFGVVGFAGFAADWSRLDALRDAPVDVLQGSTRLSGVARGTDRDGALLVERGGRLERVISGDISLRPAGHA